MKIEDLIQLLTNRLREFQLSRDYAKMNGDLERMNVADKEVLSLEDTLFKLNLLIDTSKSAAVKETTLAEVITDGSVAVLGEYDITPYATDPLHEEKIMNILSKMGVMDTAEKIDDYIKGKYLSSPVTGEMIMSSASAYIVDARLMMAIMEQDSSFGTAGKAVRTLNPGNVGNNDAGDTVTYESWQEGVTAVARWLSRHRVSEQIPEETIVVPTATLIPTTATSTPVAATSTPPIIIPTATTTTSTTTSTPTTTTSTPAFTIPEETIPVITSTTTTTSTPSTTTSTPVAATSTPPIIIPTITTTTSTATSQPEAGPPLAETPETIPVITSTTTVTSTPTTATSQPEAGPPLAETSEIIPVITSTTTTTSTPTIDIATPVAATSTPETIPVITSTTITTSTPSTTTSTE